MKNIVLIGMPATGKSTVGVILAKLLGYDFIDTDILLAKKQGRTLTRIIEEDGYESFIETEGCIGKSLSCENTVIATGGSMVFSESAMSALSKNGLIVWIDTPYEELERRMTGSLLDRGVAAPGKMTLRQIYEMREPLYRKYAGLHFIGSETTELSALKLCEELTKNKLL